MANKYEKLGIAYDSEAIKTYDLFENARGFKNSLGEVGLEKEIQRCVNFVEGRQWLVDKENDDYPYIVLNIMKQITKVRQAGIMQNDYAFLVNTLKFDDARKIQYFLKYLYNRLDIKKKNIRVIADNFKKGTSGLYFYWDKDRRSVLSNEAGELKCEVFDIRYMAVADPEITDIQDQEWIIYQTREKVGALKEQYPDKEIYSDGYLATALTQKEQVGLDEDENFVTVYTRFYRNEVGEVCYTISTPTIVLKKAQAMNPNYVGSLEEMPNTLSINDIKTYEKYAGVVFGLYPFAVYVMDARDNCFYGLPGAYEYIEAQKSINAHFSNYDYAISNNVLGGFIYRKGALGDQKITTDNAQMIEIDLKPGEKVSDIIGRIPVNNLPAESLNFGGTLTSMVKMVAGATNVQMGQADYANQTAKATEMLIQRAKENTSDYAILFEEYMKDIAEVMFMFAKFYYDKKEFNIIEHGVESDTNFEFVGEKAFSGGDYVSDDVDFDIRVSPSNALNEQMLQELAMLSVQTGNLKMLSVMKLLPYNSYASYEELKRALEQEDRTMEIMKAQEEKIKEQNEMMQMMAEEYKRMTEVAKTMDTVVAENLRLKEQIAEVYAKSVENANQSRREMQEALRQVQNMVDAQRRSKEVKK